MDKLKEVFQGNPVRTVAGAMVVILVAASALGLIDADAVQTAIGSLVLILGGEAARSQVSPKKR